MSVFPILIYLVALMNLVAISVLIYFRKSNWAIALGILEIVLVVLSSQV